MGCQLQGFWGVRACGSFGRDEDAYVTGPLAQASKLTAWNHRHEVELSASYESGGKHGDTMCWTWALSNTRMTRCHAYNVGTQ
jgi:hypothetical protein